jgi:hypothetical protein
MARPGLTTHRKFRRLVRALGSPALARGYLELLWDSCYEAGVDYVGTAADIEQAVGWAGEPGLLARALVDAGAPEGDGFIEPAPGVDGGYRVHDLWHHAPDYVAKRRKRELDRQGKSDPGVRRPAPNGDGRDEIAECLSEDGRTPSPSPSPSHSPEVHEESSTATSAAPPASRGPLEVRDPFLTFPTIGPDREWVLTETQVAEWAELYPGLDVKAEARKALAWVGATPGRRKTAKGMSRFLVGWLSRAVDSGRGQRTPMRSPVPANRFSSTPSARWVCPHVTPCSNSAQCENASLLGRPRKAAAS